MPLVPEDADDDEGELDDDDDPPPLDERVPELVSEGDVVLVAVTEAASNESLV
ncbi:hypothetical protein [Kribbia dieselivorans]|uniref:hypothetical protein n=1 Tax=Kribbia dieselivorans TaxID=331526 RepID=UPI00278C1E2D|nr:hypothetical protein [Kribbia dieselivorans]